MQQQPGSSAHATAAPTTAQFVPAVVQPGEFIRYFQYQCGRLTGEPGLWPTFPDVAAAPPSPLSSSESPRRKRLVPSRSLLRYLRELEQILFAVPHSPAASTGSSTGPANPPSTYPNGHQVTIPLPLGCSALDLSTHAFGPLLLVALLRALETFVPASLVDGNKAKSDHPPGAASSLGIADHAVAPVVVLRLQELNFTQIGLDNRAVTALCDLLLSGRCRFLQRLVMDNNELVALEAGQMLLRAFGFTGPLGDGSNGKSYRILLGSSTVPDVGDVKALPAAVALPQLSHISMDGTNVPPHYKRRVADAVSRLSAPES